MTKPHLIRTSKPKCIWRCNSLLGEGVLWVPSFNSIFFVDIKKKKILIFNIQNKKKRIIKINKEIGFISHIKKNLFVLGLKSELRVVDLKNLKIFYSMKIEQNKLYNRINDGKIDSKGRLWFSTMDNFEKKKSGSLYCLDNYFKLHKVDDGYFVPNGPAFINEHNFFHTDSRKKIIYKIKINSKYKIIKKKIFIKFNASDGSPDGMITDIKNNLWVCHYHGAKITIYDIKGIRIHTIKLPAKNITNCTFGGTRNNELYISTALKGMNSSEIRKYPLSGGLFKVNTSQRGKNTKRFKISCSVF